MPLFLAHFDLLNAQKSGRHEQSSQGKKLLKFSSRSPLKKKKKKMSKDSETDVFYHIFLSDVLDPNPYPVTQFCMNTDTQDLYFRCCNPYIVLRFE